MTFGAFRRAKVLAFLGVAMLGGSAALAQKAKSGTNPTKLLAIGTSAPDFKLPGVDGKDHSIADFKDAKLLVREDPRITISSADRRAWTAFQRQVAALATEFAPVADRARRAPATNAQTVDLKRQAQELLARISTLYGATARWTGRPTADQRSQLMYYQQMAKTLSSASL